MAARRCRFWLSTLLRARFAPEEELTAEESGSTLFRFFRSKHVADLRLIVRLAIAMLIVHAFFVGIFAAEDVHDLSTAPQSAPVTITGSTLSSLSITVAPEPKPRPATFGGKALEFFDFFSKYFGAALPVYGAIIAWAYLTASSRLGFVDLFSSEISTLCRVGTIFEVAKSSIKLLDVKTVTKTKSRKTAGYIGEEEYFPVFDQNAHDLQVLEASVVENITEFYTYMKAMRDTRRKLAEIEPQNNPPRPETDDPWQTTASNVIFVLFLAYESGRLAVDDLVEFQPSKAERTIVALLTELTCYGFLLQFFGKHFGEADLRYVRLKLRESEYRDTVAPKVYCNVADGHKRNDKDWKRAENTVPALKGLYMGLFGEDLAAASERYRAAQLEAARNAMAPRSTNWHTLFVNWGLFAKVAKMFGKEPSH
jgi:hypothetical protein